MKEKQLYNMALESIKRYKGSGETLTDFNEFMNEIEKEYSTRTYKVILTPADSGYMVTVPDFKCNTQGKDIEEAVYMARDVIEAIAAALKEMGQEIPQPNSASYSVKSEDIIKCVNVKI